MQTMSLQRKQKPASSKTHTKQAMSLSWNCYFLVLMCVSSCYKDIMSTAEAFVPHHSQHTSFQLHKERLDMTGKMDFHQIQATGADYHMLAHQSKTAMKMTLDPYEQQYQKYFGKAADGDSNVNINQNEAPQTQQTPGTGPQGSDTVTAMDPYQRQMEQYSRQAASPPTTASSQSQDGLQLQLQQAADSNPPSINTSWESVATTQTMDPYELQYQQLCNQVSAYPSGYPSASQTQSLAEAQTQAYSYSSDGAGYSSPQKPTTRPETARPEPTILSEPQPEPTHAVQSKQEEDDEKDRGDEFLRMVSSEIAYKQLKGENPYSLTDLDVAVLLQRFLDNIEDATQKYNGKTKGESKLRGEASPKKERKKIVVLGSGWAAHAFIELASTYDLRIVVVSPVNHFVSMESSTLKFLCENVKITHLTVPLLLYLALLSFRRLPMF